jgi:hypothetical protein
VATVAKAEFCQVILNKPIKTFPMKPVFKWLLALLLPAALFFNACKKQEIESPQITAETAKAQPERFPSWFIEKMKTEKRTVIIPYTEPIEVKYEDADGNILKPRNKGTNTLGIPEACDDPYSYPNDPTATIAATYSCQDGGYQFTITFELNTAFTLVGASPFNSSNLSKGRVRFINGAGTILYQNSSITPVSITSLGAGTPAGYNKYSISFTTPFLSASLFPNGYYIQPGFAVWSNCSTDPFAESAGFTDGISGMYIETAMGAPCNRLDKMYFNSPFDPPTYNINIAGTDPIGICNAPNYVHNAGSELMVLPPGSATWRHLTISEVNTAGLLIYNQPPTTAVGTDPVKYFYYADAVDAKLAPSGAWKFKYRNFMLTSGAPFSFDPGADISFTGAWSAPITYIVP